MITEAHAQRVVGAITRDLEATVGPGYERVAIAEAARIRLFATTIAEYEQRVVEDVQQILHDERINTTWPTCPQHANHPLWLTDGWWVCATVGRVARLGELSRS